jgi:hypothetical protein
MQASGRRGTPRAATSAMKTICLMILLGGATLSPAEERPVLRERGTPRATDLLRASKLAKSAERRLETPHTHSGSWLKGGGGFATSSDSVHESNSVTINVRPPRRPPHAP